MPNHLIKNKTQSILDMSPLKDVFDRGLTLKRDEEREIDDATFRNDIVQRVLKPGWIGEVAPAPVAVALPTPTPAPPKPAAAAPPLSTTPSTPAPAVVAPILTPSTPAPAVTPPEATQVMPPAKMKKLVEETKNPKRDE